ncbi:Scr1 family TA system antitoxin-like transcriptional regulator [Streptomyces sp. NPDC003032]
MSTNFRDHFSRSAARSGRRSGRAPFGKPGTHGLAADFALLDFGNTLPPRVQTDSAWGSVSTSDKPPEVDRFGRRFDAMAASALPPEDTPEYLHQLEREL